MRVRVSKGTGTGCSSQSQSMNFLSGLQNEFLSLENNLHQELMLFTTTLQKAHVVIYQILSILFIVKLFKAKHDV